MAFLSFCSCNAAISSATAAHLQSSLSLGPGDAEVVDRRVNQLVEHLVNDSEGHWEEGLPYVGVRMRQELRHRAGLQGVDSTRYRTVLACVSTAVPV
eukprot:6193579-Pleurochrysis_carterae.AAC.2